MGLDDMFMDFIYECRDYIKEREYSEEIVEKAEIIFDIMHCYIIEAWNLVDFPENIKKFREIHNISLKMRIDMREKLLKDCKDNDGHVTPEFMKRLAEEKEELKQLENNESNRIFNEIKEKISLVIENKSKREIAVLSLSKYQKELISSGKTKKYRKEINEEQIKMNIEIFSKMNKDDILVSLATQYLLELDI